jgi:hypothetical protein
MIGHRLLRGALPPIAAACVVIGSTPASRLVSAQPRDAY